MKKKIMFTALAASVAAMAALTPIDRKDIPTWVGSLQDDNPIYQCFHDAASGVPISENRCYVAVTNGVNVAWHWRCLAFAYNVKGTDFGPVQAAFDQWLSNTRENIWTNQPSTVISLVNDELTRRDIAARGVASFIGKPVPGDERWKHGNTQALVGMGEFKVKEILKRIEKRIVDERILAGEQVATVDGQNPIEAALKPYVDAVNAPMMEGVEDLLPKVGYPLDIEMLDAYRDYLAKNRQAVLTQIFRGSARMCRFLLGVDEYNRLVDKLNGKK